ncbi:hemerythrin domain-containing protein [Streptomyces sp. NRRL S-31]|uniref:hemerythrin domain-containing protein n=1 Tax=Streptomyces sp. NRRL S-31 TaxID=1463898 RepID=UPI0004C7554A|nr:hemerythrin domain-containing protein [Streptomyces sp. NRRL S-31]
MGAATSKTIKEQTVEELGAGSSILVRQRHEHQEMDRLMDQYPTLFNHALTEETVLWPAVRASVPDGEELTARVEEEHRQINDLVVGNASKR